VSGCISRDTCATRTETCRDGNIGCIAARSNENSTEARVSVPRVKVDPSASKKDLIPGTEISGTAIRLTDVPDVAGDIARRDIHAARQCNGEVLEIAADPSPFAMKTSVEVLVGRAAL
jgi:hypothetical protein